MDEFTDREKTIIELAWQAGRDYERDRLAELVDDAGPLAPPTRTYEERVAERVALFERCAAEFAAQLAANRAGARR